MTPREAFLAAWPFSVEAGVVGEEVDRALAVIDKLGFAIVPKEPTREMLMAPGVPYGGKIDPEIGYKARREAWQAMLNARISS